MGKETVVFDFDGTRIEIPVSGDNNSGYHGEYALGVLRILMQSADRESGAVEIYRKALHSVRIGDSSEDLY